MCRNPLKIDVAGICGQVNLEHQGLLSYLETSARHFLSEREPDFIVDVVPASLPDSSEQILQSDVSVASVDTTVTRNGDQYSISMVLDQSTRASASVRIGTIDAYQNRCRLDHYSEDMTRSLIMPFIRTCVQFHQGRSNGFLLHAGGLVRHGKGYLFSGPSGSGKSTVARLSDGVMVLSDDLVFVRKIHDRYCAFGTPWHGDDMNESAEIEKIFFLRQDEATRFERLSQGSATLETLGNIPSNIFDSELQTSVLDIVCDIAATVPCYRMYFSLNEPFWGIIESLD